MSFKLVKVKKNLYKQLDDELLEPLNISLSNNIIYHNIKKNGKKIKVTITNNNNYPINILVLCKYPKYLRVNPSKNTILPNSTIYIILDYGKNITRITKKEKLLLWTKKCEVDTQHYLYPPSSRKVFIDTTHQIYKFGFTVIFT